MKKILNVFTIMILLVLQVGCSATEKNTNTGNQQSTPGQAAQPKQSEKKLTKQYQMTKLSMELNNFRPIGWLASPEKLAGIKGDQLVVLDLTSKQLQLLAKPVWEATVAPNGKVLTFINEQGVSSIQSDGSGKQLIIGQYHGSQGAGSLSLGSWAPDSSKFLLINVYEWSADILEVTLAKLQPPSVNSILPAGVELLQLGPEADFLTFPVAWLGNGEILFQKHWSKALDGRQAYTEAGYRSDLAVLTTGHTALQYLTQSSDGEYVQALGASATGAQILYQQTLKAKEQPTKTTVKLLQRNQPKPVSFAEQVQAAGIFPNGEQVVLSQQTHQPTEQSIIVQQLATGAQATLGKVNADQGQLKMLFAPDGSQALLFFQGESDAQQGGYWLIEAQKGY